MPCPNCGYCPHCGRGGHGGRPSPTWTGDTWTGDDSITIKTSPGDNITINGEPITTEKDLEERLDQLGRDVTTELRSANI